MITAQCACGDEWEIEVDPGNPPLNNELDARVAVLFAADRGAEIRRLNEHVKAKHKRGR